MTLRVHLACGLRSVTAGRRLYGPGRRPGHGLPACPAERSADPRGGREPARQPRIQAAGARRAAAADQRQRLVRRRSRWKTGRTTLINSDPGDPQQPAGDRPHRAATAIWITTQWQLQLRQTVFRWDQWAALRRADSRGSAGRSGLSGRAAGPDPAHGAALLRRARRAGHRRRRAGDARGVLPPARAGGQALRGRPDRDHRRAGSARGARPGGGGRDRGEAHAGDRAGAAARAHRRVRSIRSPRRSKRCRSKSPDPENEEQWVAAALDQNLQRDFGAAGDRHRQAGRAHRALRPLPDASTSSPAAGDQDSKATRSVATQSVTSRPEAPGGSERRRPTDRRPGHAADLLRRRHVVARPSARVSAPRSPRAPGAREPRNRACDARRLPRCAERDLPRQGAAPGARIQPHGLAGDRGRLRSRYAHDGRRARSRGGSCSTRRRTIPAADTTTSSTCCSCSSRPARSTGRIWTRSTPRCASG